VNTPITFKSRMEGIPMISTCPDWPPEANIR
jgi:hypothetical protein